MNQNKLQKEIASELSKNKTGVILWTMRTGKTNLTTQAIKLLKPSSILWITPEADHKTQIPEEFIKWKAKGYLKKLTVVTTASIHKLEFEEFDLVVYDEIQSISHRIYSAIKNIDYNNLWGLTGTYPQGEDKQNWLDDLSLGINDIVHEITLDQAVEAGILNDYEIIVHRLFLDNKDKYIEAGGKHKKWMTTEWKQYESLNKWRLNLLYSGDSKKREFSFQLAIRIKRFFDSCRTAVEHSKSLIEPNTIIYTQTKACAEKFDNYYHSSADTGYQDFVDGKITSLAVVGKAATGATFPYLNNIIIQQCDRNKNGSSEQRLGRGMIKKDKKTTIHIHCFMGTINEGRTMEFVSKFKNVTWK